MYTDYKRCAAEAGQKILSYMSYWRQIKQMNISFAKLGVEECEFCNEFKIHINEKESPVADGTEIIRKKTRKNKSSDSTDVNKSKTKTSVKERCVEKCAVCDRYAIHAEEKRLSLEHCVFDKAAAETDKGTLYFSCDLQKVIPRLPGYKKRLFTSRLISFNMTFIGRRREDTQAQSCRSIVARSSIGKKRRKYR